MTQQYSKVLNFAQPHLCGADITQQILSDMFLQKCVQ